MISCSSEFPLPGVKRKGEGEACSGFEPKRRVPGGGLTRGPIRS